MNGVDEYAGWIPELGVFALNDSDRRDVPVRLLIEEQQGVGRAAVGHHDLVALGIDEDRLGVVELCIRALDRSQWSCVAFGIASVDGDRRQVSRSDGQPRGRVLRYLMAEVR